LGRLTSGVGEKTVQTHTASAGAAGDAGVVSTDTKTDVLFYFSPETARIQWLLRSKIVSGDNLPALLISKLTSNDPLYLQRGQKALSPLHFYTGIDYARGPSVKI